MRLKAKVFLLCFLTFLSFLSKHLLWLVGIVGSNGFFTPFILIHMMLFDNLLSIGYILLILLIALFCLTFFWILEKRSKNKKPFLRISKTCRRKLERFGSMNEERILRPAVSSTEDLGWMNTMLESIFQQTIMKNESVIRHILLVVLEMFNNSQKDLEVNLIGLSFGGFVGEPERDNSIQFNHFKTKLNKRNDLTSEFDFEFESTKFIVYVDVKVYAHLLEYIEQFGYFRTSVKLSNILLVSNIRIRTSKDLSTIHFSLKEMPQFDMLLENKIGASSFASQEGRRMGGKRKENKDCDNDDDNEEKEEKISRMNKKDRKILQNIPSLTIILNNEINKFIRDYLVNQEMTIKLTEYIKIPDFSKKGARKGSSSNSVSLRKRVKDFVEKVWRMAQENLKSEGIRIQKERELKRKK